MLEKHKFLEIITNTPLVSIDLIIKNKKNEVLLGYRNNRPAKGFWFVPGGRIRKNETIDEAFERILAAETGMIFQGEKKLLGVYDHIYNDNFANVPNINTHYVVIGFEIQVNNNVTIVKDEQHKEYKWIKINEILQSDNVHKNTKNYFR